MRKPKRKDIVLSILKLIETARPPKKVYGYFTRRQLIELHAYLLLQNGALDELHYKAASMCKELKKRRLLTFYEWTFFLRDCMRLSSVKGD